MLFFLVVLNWRISASKVQTHSGVAMVGKIFRRIIGTPDSYSRHSWSTNVINSAARQSVYFVTPKEWKVKPANDWQNIQENYWHSWSTKYPGMMQIIGQIWGETGILQIFDPICSKVQTVDGWQIIQENDSYSRHNWSVVN